MTDDTQDIVAVTPVPLKDEWELRADIEAEERRAQQISLADITAAEFKDYLQSR